MNYYILVTKQEKNMKNKSKKINTLIVTGGNVNIKFLKEYLEENKFNAIIAVDKGLEALDKIEIIPNYIIGDFDSINKEILKQYENRNIPITYLKPEKDFTDTHMALKLAIKIRSSKITIIGAIGTRIDHSLANIHILKEALENGIEAQIVDEYNKIFLLNKGINLNKDLNYRYISLIPLTNMVEGITLEGFKYKLENANLNIGESIGISNEQLLETANIKIKSGILIVNFSKD